MSYGLKYQGEFDSISNQTYRLEILEKDYIGNFSTLSLAASPVIHQWNTDDIKAPIKGSSLTINYLNRGSDPIENFFSVNDDQYRVDFYIGTDLLFTGFLVQDDFLETMVDYTHVVTLRANDNLGLLKDLALDSTPAIPLRATVAEGETILGLNWIHLTNTNYRPVVGIPFLISGHSNALMNQVFSVAEVTPVSASAWDVRVTFATGNTTADAIVLNSVGTSIDYGGFLSSCRTRIRLLDIVHGCLNNTGLELDTYIYCNLYSVSNELDNTFLGQTYINASIFADNSEKFDNCYNVLSKVLTAFNLTLFQSLGRWNIVRWDELRLTNAIPAFQYDKYFVVQGTSTLPTNVIQGFGQTSYPEFGLVKSIFRPYEFVKETFNYEIPKYILKNNDLLKLGTLLNTYTVGTVTYREYTAPNWLDGYGTNIITRGIRVAYDNNLQTEIERYIYLSGNTYDSARSVQSNCIDVQAGDKVKFSFRFRTNTTPNITSWGFALRLTDGTQNRYVDDIPAGAGDWTPGVNYTYLVTTGVNIREWQDVSIESSAVPFDGQVFCYLAQITPAPQVAGKESQYSDMRFEYIPSINDSIKIIGNVHKSTQTTKVKNNSETDIYIDDSPRNSIGGTLFTGLYVGLLQYRTIFWYRNPISENRKLGDIITTENMQWRNEPRTKLDGSFRGLIQFNIISMLSWTKYVELPGLYFLFGNLEIDYREDKYSGVQWEIFKSSEIDGTFDYTFTYLYEKQ